MGLSKVHCIVCHRVHRCYPFWAIILPGAGYIYTVCGDGLQ